MLSFPDFKAKKIVVIFAKYGEHFSFKNDNLLVTDNAKNVILQDSCYQIFSIWIVGSCTISTGLLERSKKFGITILMLNHSFRLIGSWNAATEGNFLLRKKQYDFQNQNLANFIIYNKITNQITLLKNIRHKDGELENAIHLLQNYKENVWDAKSIQQLMGIEGASSKLYFKHIFAKLPFKGRKPRTKSDPLNVVLDIGYTKLFYFIECLLNLYGFDIYQGFLHQNFYKRKSLICDLQEPFRPLVDKIIKNAYGLKQFKEEDFIYKNYQYFLDIEKNKYYTKWLLDGILEYEDAIFLYVQKFYRAFIKNDEIKNYPEFLLT
ncbi:MAG: type V CRISPR-associated endonuclease Cas1 [Campylobacteraceae bacterium]|jgi:CRISPR-associated protein Cas1|nr:type V CRISPR-associated endonuclease Cas1 [Campylobacteraceae bacterium]